MTSVRRFGPLLALLLAACGTTGARIDVAPVAAMSFSFADERSQHARAGERYSYGDQQFRALGDDAVRPAGPEIVRAWLQRELSEPLRGATVTLEQFTITIREYYGRRSSVTQASTQPSSFMNPLAALVGIGIGRVIDSGSKKEAVAVRISGRVGDQPFYGGANQLFEGGIPADALDSLVKQALAEMVASIKARPDAPGSRP